MVRVTLIGHLTLEVLEAALREAEGKLGDRCGLLVDCLEMTDYTAEARAAFVAWHRRHGPRIRRVAVVTPNPLYHMIVTAMSLASGTKMKAFSEATEGMGWLQL
ncbi:MAG: STAS/SEC14 domain-containing protein [Myxococcales bacterium]|nr:STAS/SEC14 domain-containing protein [Myxococcales bacterium]